MRNKFIAGLRELADFLETNPTFPTPTRRTLNFFCADEDAVPDVAQMMGKCAKFDYMYSIGLRRKFQAITLQINWAHSKVCRRVKTGGTVTEYISTGHEKREYPEYKWVCPNSFLKGESK